MIAITGTRSFFSGARSSTHSRVRPLLDITIATSTGRTRPRSPCRASLACSGSEGVPVEARVAEIFCPILNALPMPVITT